MAQAPAKEKPKVEKSKGKRKESLIQDNIELPQKFKEEDRVFFGAKETWSEEKEQGIVGKMIGLAMYGSLKVTLDHLDAIIKKNAITELPLDQHLRHYLKKGLHPASANLKCISQMLIEQARHPQQTIGTQVVLMFKSIDCLRMVIQYSPAGIDNLPAYLALQIMAKMPPAFVPHMNREKQIFNLNINLQRAIKEGVPTINVRNKLAGMYLKQKCYADALFQYESILKYFLDKKPQTPNDKEKICVIHLSIGDMYKDIYNFKGEFKNGQILQNFVFRYNRDADIIIPSRTSLTPITGQVNKLTVTHLYKDLKQLTVDHYEKALSYFPKSKNQKKKSEILITLGQLYAEMGKAVDGAGRLQDSLLLLGKQRNSEEMFKVKEETLELMRNCIAKVPAGDVKEKFKSFVVKEENTLESDKMEWEEDIKKKENIRQQAEKGSSKKVL
ncbi:MAG: hypothetical protein HQM13_22345 [SAR324 cluster bacterium]|nr:hypothetical protein [SAR324 cluster bacterium]